MSPITSQEARDRRNARLRESYALDPRPQRERTERYRDANRERVRELTREQTKRWRQENAHKLPEINRRQNLRRKGLTPEQFDTILAAQNYGCAICGAKEPGGNGNFRVDHDHACCGGSSSCGRCVRGLLCNGCNSALGHMKDNAESLRKAADYLDAATAFYASRGYVLGGFIERAS